MSKTETATKERVRKSKARHSTIVMAAIEERLLMVEQTDDLASVKAHVARIDELLDELKRGSSKDSADE